MNKTKVFNEQNLNKKSSLPIPDWYRYLKDEETNDYLLIDRPKGEPELPRLLRINQNQSIRQLSYSSQHLIGCKNRKWRMITYLFPSYKNKNWYLGSCLDRIERLVFIRKKNKFLDVFIYPYHPDLKKQGFQLLNDFAKDWKENTNIW